MQIAVFGHGAVGGRLPDQLSRGPLAPVIDSITVVSRDGVAPDPPRTFPDAPDPRTPRPDIPIHHVAAGALPRCDIGIIALPAGEHAATARSLLGQGAQVVSVSDNVDDVRGLRALDDEARERRSQVVIGAGFAPGLSCVLARHGARSLDTVTEIHVAKHGTGGPACARQHHAALKRPARDYRHGGWLRRPGGSGRELVWFPAPIEGADCYRAELVDPGLLVPAFPGVERVSARVAATRRDRLTSRLPMLTPPHAEGGVGAIRVELWGTRAGEQEVGVYGVAARPAHAAAVVAATSAAMIGQTLISDETDRTGLRAPVGVGRTASRFGVDRFGAAGLGQWAAVGPFLTAVVRAGLAIETFEGLQGFDEGTRT